MENKWIGFKEVTPPSFKTKVWDVLSKQHGSYLGQIKFYPQWRQYVFHPSFDCIFSEGCLKSIAEFCLEETNKWKEVK